MVTTTAWKKSCMESPGQYTFMLSKNPSCLKERGIPFISGFYIRFCTFYLHCNEIIIKITPKIV